MLPREPRGPKTPYYGCASQHDGWHFWEIPECCEIVVTMQPCRGILSMACPIRLSSLLPLSSTALCWSQSTAALPCGKEKQPVTLETQQWQGKCPLGGHHSTRCTCCLTGQDTGELPAASSVLVCSSQQVPSAGMCPGGLPTCSPDR